jgi:hypothetical protein
MNNNKKKDFQILVKGPLSKRKRSYSSKFKKIGEIYGRDMKVLWFKYGLLIFDFHCGGIRR